MDKIIKMTKNGLFTFDPVRLSYARHKQIMRLFGDRIDLEIRPDDWKNPFWFGWHVN